jgi:phosphoribosylglycinamide formyltransferase-1
LSLKKIVIFASGSGSSAENIIIRLKEKEEISIEKIYCNNPKALVLERIKKYNIKKLVFENNDLEGDKVLNDLISINPNIIILAGFLKKIPLKIIKHFKNKIINIHPSLLPNYGGKGMYGMIVHRSVIQNREKKSGFTIHYVDEHYDTGNIIFQKSINVETETPEDLAKQILSLEHKHYPTVIKEILNVKS